MAVVVNSATLVSTVSGNGGGRINTFDVSVDVDSGETAVLSTAILTAIGLGSGYILGAQDRGGIALIGPAAAGVLPYYDEPAMEIRFANSVTGAATAALSVNAHGAHFTVTVQQ